MKQAAQSRFWQSILPTVALLVAGCGLLLWMITATPQPAQATDGITFAQSLPVGNGSGADLTVEVSVNPALPAPNQEVTIAVLVRNIGTLDTVGNFRVYLYVDPTDRPPTTGTAETYSVGYPSLRAGRDTSFSRTHTFTTQDCDHIIYVWVDRDNAISESNEQNNLLALPVCVGVTCSPDSYETDNQCSAAGWLAEGAPQARTLCDPNNATQPDSDWLKFTAFTGVTYTLQSENGGVHAQGTLKVYNACGGNELATGTNGVSWQAPSDGVYYANFTQANNAIGPLSAYSLTLRSDTGITDDYEPDDRCTNARDISTDETRQTHLFQSPNDQDWIKFAIAAGESFIVIADNTGPGVNPVVTLFDSCSQVAANDSLAFGVQQVATSATTNRTYYARITNQNGANFGPNAKYDIRVAASACLPDSAEEDDSAQQAKVLAVGQTTAGHNFCPASDEDWVKFSAQAGKVYVLRTANLAFAADTLLQLYGTDGTTVISENDDYGYISASRIVWSPTTSGEYYARITHVNPVANGPNTQYDFLINEGYCSPDDQEGSTGDNGPGDATLARTDGISQTHNFCADPLDLSLGDQDWVRIDGVANGNYQIFTTGLGPNSDPVLELYDSNGSTQL
ncbi:MAG: hypothetical protein KDE47_07550, partial [Caldilineaceae bacterium]|nr:hypothetical protein [Caldilineaceae bacterium]